VLVRRIGCSKRSMNYYTSPSPETGIVPVSMSSVCCELELIGGSYAHTVFSAS